MRTKRKAIILSLCMVMIAVASAFGTFAYLTDHEGVTNTFTVGKVGLKLDEADVKTDGTLDTNDRVQSNEYHLLPGHTYIKDPTVTVDAKSEDAYVRMLVKVERIDLLKDALPNDNCPEYYSGDIFLLQMLCDGWNNAIWVYKGYTQTDGGKTGTYEFRYAGNAEDTEGNMLNNGIVIKSDNETKLPALFQSITVPGEIDNNHLEYLKAVKIIVNAHAIQADGFSTADQAWDAFE